ncbi:MULTISPECIES: cypemycin family RiPP [unclassified Streptomyces]|uniref:cypemycin family RiPP n=1 Tax=unclassified Streptomyces TaxID=2593676 RepID=UPI00234B25B9|nr:cypemycin family RiPP [Streptomyces sp. M92]WCN01029.1 cypemycin family RiPP [Streptomyces sp. M92]
MRLDSNTAREKAEIRPEALAAQEFANSVLDGAAPGFHADAQTPAMVTPATPTAAQFVIQGSTICLVC